MSFSFRRLTRRKIALFLPLAATLVYACGPATEAETALFEGEVTDEAFIAMEAALEQGEPVVDATKAAVLDSPAEGAALPAATPADFMWHIGSAASERDMMPHEGSGRLAQASRRRGTWLSLGVPSAHAHGDPFTGTATYLLFSTDANTALLQVFTDGTSYTPAAAEWETLKSAGAPITVSLVTADYENNAIVDGGGPFDGAKITFTITE